jgi:hypothetical protein
MKLKKLILSVLGLFVLVAVSYAAGDPNLPPNYKPRLKSYSNGSATWCNFSKADPDKEYPGVIDPNYKFKFPARYIKVSSVFELLDDAVNKNDKIATELVAWCMRAGSVIRNIDGIPFVIVISFYESPNSVKIIRHLMENDQWMNESTTYLPFRGSTRTDITIASEYGHKEILKALLTPAPKNKTYNPNPYAKVMDYLEDQKGKMKDSFDFARKNSHIQVLELLKKVPKTTALIEDAARKTINYAMTNEKWILRAMREIADNSIFRDGLRLFDINGYKTDITRI